jgi:Asp-tRNA(Asn)/Glu-tRNA(Gln) amidotransferase A subunit family amidase
MPIEIYVDHTGPMTGTVKDNALLLEVIAGADGYDPRQYSPKVHPYTEALGRGVDGLKVGIVKEGFGLPNSERDVDARSARRASCSASSARRSPRSRSRGTRWRARSGSPSAWKASPRP